MIIRSIGNCPGIRNTAEVDPVVAENGNPCQAGEIQQIVKVSASRALAKAVVVLMSLHHSKSCLAFYCVAKP